MEGFTSTIPLTNKHKTQTINTISGKTMPGELNTQRGLIL